MVRKRISPIDMPAHLAFEVILQALSDQFKAFCLLALVEKNQSFHGHSLAMLWEFLEHLQGSCMLACMLAIKESSLNERVKRNGPDHSLVFHATAISLVAKLIR